MQRSRDVLEEHPVNQARRTAGKAGHASLALGPGGGTQSKELRMMSTASTGPSSARSTWCAASACCWAGNASTFPAHRLPRHRLCRQRSLRRGRPKKPRPRVRSRGGPRRGVARRQGRCQGQGAGRDRSPHRRPASGSAAQLRRLGVFSCRPTTAHRCGRGRTLTAPCRSPSPAPASHPRGNLPTTRSSPPRQILTSIPDTS